MDILGVESPCVLNTTHRIWAMNEAYSSCRLRRYSSGMPPSQLCWRDKSLDISYSPGRENPPPQRARPPTTKQKQCGINEPGCAT